MMKKQAFLLFGGFTVGKYPNFISAIKKYNLDILVIDIKNESTESNILIRKEVEGHPFQKITEFAIIDPTKIQKILKQILIWRDSYDIKGVYSIRESFVEIVGLVADYLNLPSPGFRASQVCRNKFLQRLYCDKWSPVYVCIPSEKKLNFVNNLNLNFPVVLKPIGREGSSGVIKLNSKNEMKEALENGYNLDDAVLIEEFIEGREYSVETLVQNGEIIFSSPTQKRTNEIEGNYFVEMSHTVPAINLKIREYNNLLEINKQILEKLNFQNGVSHAEFKIDIEGNIYLMEIASRNPGDGILQLYHMSTGTPMEEVLIEIALGKDTKYPNPRRFARQVYFNHTPGELVDITVDKDIDITPVWLRNTLKRPGLNPSDFNDKSQIKELLIERNKGDQLFEIKESKDRCGSFIYDSNIKDNLDDLELHYISKISLISDLNRTR